LISGTTLKVIPSIRTSREREKGKVSPKYAKDVKARIENHVKKHYPNKPVDEMTVFELDECSRQIESSMNRESIDGTINQSLSWAFKKGLIKTDIASKLDKHKHEREQGIPFTRDEHERILEHAKKHSRYSFALMVYLNTSCRPGELKEIRHCDFNFDTMTLFINGTKTKLSKRYVPLPMSMLAFRNQIKDNSQDKVFTCKVSTLQTELNRILVALEIDTSKYTLKSTRHSFATRCREKGIDEKVIQKWMGHSNSKMTDHYTHILTEFEQQQAVKLNQLLSA